MLKRFLFFSFLLFPTVLLADTATDQLKPILDSFQSLTANFNQLISDSRGKEITKSTGQMVVHRPDKFRWETLSPNRQLIIANGQKLWIYDIDLEQVSIQPFKQTKENSPARLLSGDIELISEDFYINVVSENESNILFQLTPKNKDHYFQWIDISFKKTDHYPEKVLNSMKMKDNLDQITAIEFKNVIKNPKLKSDIFNFVPPAGVDVISGD